MDSRIRVVVQFFFCAGLSADPVSLAGAVRLLRDECQRQKSPDCEPGFEPSGFMCLSGFLEGWFFPRNLNPNP